LQGCLLVSGFWASSALAQEASPAVTAGLQLDAAASCASRQALVAGVAQRSSRIRLVASAAATPALRASLRLLADGSIAAELVVIHAGGRRSLRRLSAPSCAEAVDALALVIAITLDPASASEHGSGSGTGDASKSNDASSRPGAAEQGEKSDAARVSGRTGEAPAAESDSSGGRADGADAESAVEFHWQVGADVSLLLGPAPRLMPGVGLELLAAWDGPSLWSPAVRVSAAHYWLSGLSESGGTADFALDAGSFDLCPFRLGGRVVWLRLCANAQAGRLHAQGSRTFSPQSRSRPFAVLGGSSSFTAKVSSRLVAGAAFSAGRTLFQDEFVFASKVFYGAPPVSLGFGLSLAVGFR
jgi:hypothetical protein